MVVSNETNPSLFLFILSKILLSNEKIGLNSLRSFICRGEKWIFIYFIKQDQLLYYD
jgi:hypothetical protein